MGLTIRHRVGIVQQLQQKVTLHFPVWVQRAKLHSLSHQQNTAKFWR